ncbi:hypothetical protein ACIRJO_18025 [Streptomyces sp. NPDC102394]|uniref:hypothetical protein n=1 Tax=Streptomyces sp. NPDC102394 TaxID=3366167 RepID=UPI00380A2168
MDAAIVGALAGVVGAAVGAGGAVAAAAVSGRQQSQGQHEQWRRDVRRTAYAAFLTAARKAHSQISDTHSMMATAPLRNGNDSSLSGPILEALGSAVTAVVAALEQVHSAVTAVELEGPEGVADACLHVSHGIHLWATREMNRWAPEVMASAAALADNDGTLLRAGSVADFPDDYRSQETYVNRDIAAFAILCRRILDRPAGSLN